MTTKRVALYARVSTLNHGQDPEVQLRELRAYCERRGFEIADTYIDKGIKGSREHRPALDKLMTDCRKRLVDGVVVYRYDRFARSLRHLVNALEEFRALDIEFISLHEGVDTSTPNGRLVFGIFASIAEFERELIRDRVRSGLAAAKARGKRVGRPRVSVNALRIASLRDQGRSCLLKANVEDVKVVQESLRHANSRITLDIYTQAVTPAKRQAQGKVVRMIQPTDRASDIEVGA